ncbi:DUF2628 domain-containing protein [Phreatobacter sp. HK31-P]
MARQTSFTVHLPPAGLDKDEAIEFVPDSFSPIAFLAPWAWFAWNRMWLVTFAYLAVIGLLVLGLILAGLSPMMRTLITSALSLLIGLEATNLKRWTLRRRGFREVAVVVATSRGDAERHYFAERTTGAATRTDSPSPGRPLAPAQMQASQPVIGLFPEAEPGGRGAR